MKVALHIYASATIDATSQNLTQPVVIERDTLQLRPRNPHESPERILSTTHIPHTYLYAVYTVTSDGAANVYIIPHHELYPS